MNDHIFGIPNMDVYLIIGILSFFILLEIIAGYLQDSKRTFSDWIQEAGSYFVLALVIKPIIVIFMLWVGNTLLLDLQNALQKSSLWLSLPLFLFIDDFMQYWYHRSAHEYPFLWKLHRPHHQAEEMGFFVSYRNAALYYLLMPNIWWIGFFTFLGGVKAVAIGLVLKQLIIISSHSRVTYDKYLYQYRFLNPIATIWERIFITPAFHHAHHGKSKIDGISDPNRNFGNMFSIWDQLFGTAFFSRKFPLSYGLENDPKDHWTAAYFYPVIASDIQESEISRGHQKTLTTTMAPITVELQKGKNYLWCRCGMSKNVPFCDGTHHGTKFKPQFFTAKKSGPARICNCKLTKVGPFCDDSHLK